MAHSRSNIEIGSTSNPIGLVTPCSVRSAYKDHMVDWIKSLHSKSTGVVIGDELSLSRSAVCAFLGGMERDGSGIARVLILSSCYDKAKAWVPTLYAAELVPVNASFYKYEKASSRHDPIFDLFSKFRNGGKNGILLTTLEKVRKNEKKFRKNQWDYVIIDKVDLIKSPNGVLHEKVIKINSAHYILLSGEPMPNKKTELTALFGFCCPDSKELITGTVKEIKNHVKQYFMRDGTYDI